MKNITFNEFLYLVFLPYDLFVNYCKNFNEKKRKVNAKWRKIMENCV
jgi:hypothetical protein